MKVYQTIHKYPPHIPQFEAKHGITDNSSITFEELRKLLVDDGFFSTYILLPALEHKTEEVFYTIWNYNRLQYLWAKEHGLDTTDLSEIKLAQLEWFQPDVFYNLSPYNDQNFIELLKLRGIKCKTVCWNGVIQERPMTFPLYDAHLTLHKPYINYWKGLGLKAFELQPGIPMNWEFEKPVRPIDVLFYGQYIDTLFTGRNRLINQLIDYGKLSKYLVDVHLQFNKKKHAIFHIPKVKLAVSTFPPRKIRKYAKSSIYGSELYTKIASSKIVVNAYTDNNKDYKSNMRLFEAMGHGAFLISERGNYPEGLIPDIDFYTYIGFEELKEKIEFVLANWNDHQKIAKRAAEKIKRNFSKEFHWERFQKIIDSI